MAAGRATELAISLGAADDAGGWLRRLALVDRAEALGLHSVWLPEGHFHRGATPSPLIALAAFAARTRRLRLGTSSLLLPVHHPVRIAHEVATLDQLSRGRVLLGLGRGFRAPLFRAFGVPPAEKRDRFDVALDAILAVWGGADGLPAGWRMPTRQRPHPPLFVAAFGRKGLAQAARRGLPYLASPVETLEQLAENHAWHRAHLAPGADAGGLPVAAIRTVHVAGDDAEARRVLGALADEARGLAGRAPAALARAAAARLEERVLVGTRERVADGIEAYRARIGLSLLIARTQVPGATEHEQRASLERLAGELAPRFGAGAGAPRPAPAAPTPPRPRARRG